MAHTIKFGYGRADATVTISGTEWIIAYGPPSSGQAQHRGRFGRQISGSNGTWRWLNDEPTPGTASPTTYSFASITR